jgi:hypothetical protein
MNLTIKDSLCKKTVMDLCAGDESEQQVIRFGSYNIVTYRPIARQRLGEHIPAGANERNNRTSIARQQISKQA